MRSKASSWDDLKISTPHWVAFKHDTGILIGGDDDEGGGRVVHTWNEGHLVRADQVDSFVKTRDAYIRLHNWISDQVQKDPEKVRQVSISIGPKGSYFARCGTAQTSYALPKDLENSLEESNSYPINIALGKQGAWIVLFADGSRDWNLRHIYPTLAATSNLSDNTDKPVFAALNPYAEDQYFVVTEKGSCNYRTPLSEEVQKMTDTYMRTRAIRDGSSFSHTVTVGGVPKEARYTPNSWLEETRTEAMLAKFRGRVALVKRRDVIFVGAVAGGTGFVAKIAGIPTLRAFGVAASAGVGAAMTMWYRDTIGSPNL